MTARGNPGERMGDQWRSSVGGARGSKLFMGATKDKSDPQGDRCVLSGFGGLHMYQGGPMESLEDTRELGDISKSYF